MAKGSGVLFAVAVAVLTFGPRANATPIMSGDVFRVTFTDTSPMVFAFLDSDPSQNTTIPNPDFGAVTAADFTLGAPVGSGIFRISNVTNLVGTPPFLTVDFSALSFDASLLGLTGTISDTYLGGGGGLHADLLKTFLPSSLGSPGTWTLSDDRLSDQPPITLVTSGTYVATPATPAVPEPASLLLLGTGLIGAGVRRYRRGRR
jgi:hypothetical protein